MLNPEVTVLMSVFNEQTYLREAIESILSQTFSDFEFLIIDDGSKEPIEDLIAEYKDSRIGVFVRKTWDWHVLSTEVCIWPVEITSPGWMLMTFVDRIDWICKSRQMEAHPQIDLLGSFFDIIDEKRKIDRDKGTYN